MEANTLARETNARLVDRFVKLRDGEAFAELVRRFGPMVLGISRRLLSNREDADDATQIVFAELARRAGTIEDPALVGAWLHTITVRVARRMRSRRPNTEPLVTDPVDPRLNLVDVGRRSDLEILSEELDHLPASWREPLLMRYFTGVSNADAAAQLGTTQKAYEGRLKRGRNSLRVRLLRRGVGSTVVLALVGPSAVQADPGYWDAVTDAATDLAADPTALTFVPTESATLSTPFLSTKGIAMTGAAAVVLALLGGQGDEPGTKSAVSPISTVAADEPDGEPVPLEISPVVPEHREAKSEEAEHVGRKENLVTVYELMDLWDADDQPIQALRDIRALAENPPTSIEESTRDGADRFWVVFGSNASHRAIEALIQNVRQNRPGARGETQEQLDDEIDPPIASETTTNATEPHPFEKLPVWWNGLNNQAFGTISLGHLIRDHQPLPPNFWKRLEARIRAADPPVAISVAQHDGPSTWTWYSVSLKASTPDSEEVPSINKVTQAVGGFLHREAVAMLAAHRQLATTDDVRKRLQQVVLDQLDASPIPLDQPASVGSDRDEWEPFDDLVRAANRFDASQYPDTFTPNGLSTATTILQHYDYPADVDGGFLAKKTLWGDFVDRVNNTHLKPHGTAISLLNVSADGTATIEIPKSLPGLPLLVLKELDDLLPDDFFEGNPAAKSKLSQSYRDMLSNVVEEHGDAVPQWLRKAIDDTDATPAKDSGDDSADSTPNGNQTLLISQHGFELLIDPDDVEGSWRELIKDINKRLIKPHGESVNFVRLDGSDVELLVSNEQIGLDVVVIRELLAKRVATSREQTKLFEEYLNDSLRTISEKDRRELPAWIRDEIAKPIDVDDASTPNSETERVTELAADTLQLVIDGQKVLVTTDADGKLSLHVQATPADDETDQESAR